MKTGSKFGHLMKLNCDKRLHLVGRFLYSDIPGMTNATKNIPFSRVLYYGGGPPALGDLPLPHWKNYDWGVRPPIIETLPESITEVLTDAMLN